MTNDKALKLAREGVEIHSPSSPEYIVCAALIEVLAQLEQEPVAYLHQCGKKPELKELSFKKNEPSLFAKGYKSIPLGYTTPPQRKPLTVAMVSKAARVLNDRQAEACGVDKDDQWKVYGHDFIEDARAMLNAAHSIKGDA